MSFYAGDVVHISVTWRDSAGNLADPSTQTLRFVRLTPANGQAVVQWTVTTGQIVRDSKGAFHADVPFKTFGTWAIRFDASGGDLDAPAKNETTVEILPSNFK